MAFLKACSFRVKNARKLERDEIRKLEHRTKRMKNGVDLKSYVYEMGVKKEEKMDAKEEEQEHEHEHEKSDEKGDVTPIGSTTTNNPTTAAPSSIIKRKPPILLPESVREYEINHQPTCMKDAWDEWFYGRHGRPAIVELDQLYSTWWRKRGTKNGRRYQDYQQVIAILQKYIEQGNSEGKTFAKADKIWKSGGKRSNRSLQSFRLKILNDKKKGIDTMNDTL